MSNIKKLMMSGAAGGGGLDVDDVFETFLWTGQGSFSNTNNIDMSTEGGAVWIKNRTYASGRDWRCFSTGLTSLGHHLIQNSTSGEQNLGSQGIQSFNTDGWTLGSGNSETNASGWGDYAAWTFRKAPKFFDIVRYTGNGTSGRTVSHNLGCDVGCIMIKDINNANSWVTYHRGVGATKYLELNGDSSSLTASWMFNNTDPTSSVFTLGNNVAVNYSGREYVAYLFAHNDGDGEFGPDGDADIIKCGSYTGNGIANGPEIDLGFEPQWVLIKKTNLSSDWVLMDSMRGITTGGYDAFLRPNLQSTEVSDELITLQPTGFKLASNSSRVNSSAASPNYIYIAIRRGSLFPPESASDVFAIDQGGGSSNPALVSGFPVDMAIRNYTTGNNHDIANRLSGGRMYTDITNAEDTYGSFDYNNGYQFHSSPTTAEYHYMWKRAPGYFDVVAYEGAYPGSQDISHNLGVAPEMMWVKARNASAGWKVYHKDLNYQGAGDTSSLLFLEANYDQDSSTNIWGTTSPTDTVFTVGNPNTNNNYSYIAYLFASLDGISKVGSYVGTGTTQTIDLGFAPRFFLTKGATQNGPWYVVDTERGIVAGNDPLLALEDGSAQLTSYDVVDPIANGIQIVNSSLNDNGQTYIFYAIA